MTSLAKDSYNINFVNGLDKERIEVNIKTLENLVESDSLKERVQDLRLALDASYKQQEAYGNLKGDINIGGIQKWNEDFQKLVTIFPEFYETQAQSSLAKAEELRIKFMRELFYSMPYKARIFQEVFSEPGEFVVSTDPQSMTCKRHVLGSIASLRLISEDLMENLGLCDFSDCSGNPYKRLEKIADENVITALKLIFLEMTPIDGDKGRVFILNPVYSEDKNVNQILEKYNKECAKKLAMISTLGVSDEILSIDGVKGFHVHRKKMSIVRDIYSAYRTLVNIENRYESESKDIRKLQSRIELIGEKLNNWAKDTEPSIKENTKQELINLCTSSIEKFSKIKNAHKKEAIKFFNDIIEHVKVKTNPRANVMQLVGAYNRLNKRFKEFNSIQMYEGKDSRMILNLIRGARNNFDIINSTVSNIYNDIKDKALITSQTSEDVLYQLGSLVGSFSKFPFSPYKEFSKKISLIFDEMKNELNDECAHSVIIKYLSKMKYYLYLESNVIRYLNSALKVGATCEEANIAIEKVISSATQMMNSSQDENEKKQLGIIYNRLKNINDEINKERGIDGDYKTLSAKTRESIKTFLDEIATQII